MRPTPLKLHPPSDALEDRVHVAAEALAAADRNRPVPLRLDGVAYALPVEAIIVRPNVNPSNADPPSSAYRLVRCGARRS